MGEPVRPCRLIAEVAGLRAFLNSADSGRPANCPTSESAVIVPIRVILEEATQRWLRVLHRSGHGVSIPVKRPARWQRPDRPEPGWQEFRPRAPVGIPELDD